MFGNLTLAFVQFGTAIQGALAPGAGPAAMQAFNDAADSFKRAAADDALYLACIGKFPLFPLALRPTFSLLPPSRYRLSLWTHGPMSPPTPTPTPHPVSILFAPFPRVFRGGCNNLVAEWLTLHFRNWFDCDNLYIHVDMDIHGRSQCEAHPRTVLESNPPPGHCVLRQG